MKDQIFNISPEEPGQVSFETLFLTYFAFLHEVSFYIVNNEETARDLVQDFFLKCWHRKEKLHRIRDFKSYAFRSVKNASLSWLEQIRKTSTGNYFDMDKAPSQQEITENFQEENARNKALWEAIDKLPQQRRVVFLMSNRDDLSYRQIADKLSISVNTVKTQIRLALQYLREECSWLMYLCCLFFIKTF